MTGTYFIVIFSFAGPYSTGPAAKTPLWWWSSLWRLASNERVRSPSSVFCGASRRAAVETSFMTEATALPRRRM